MYDRDFTCRVPKRRSVVVYKGVFDRFKPAGLVVKVSEIVLHKADVGWAASCDPDDLRALNPSGSVGAMDVRVEFVERNRTPISLHDTAVVTPQPPRFGNAA